MTSLLLVFALGTGPVIVPGSATESNPSARVITVGSEPLTGTPLKFEEDRLRIAVSDGTKTDPVTVPIAEILRVQYRSARDLPDVTDTPHLRLANGDLIGGEVTGFVEESLRVNPTFLPPESPPLSVPLETVSEVVFVPGAAAFPPIATTDKPIIAQDRLLLRNGDLLNGEFLDWTDDGLIWETGTAEVTIDPKRVARLRFNSELIDFPQPTGIRSLIRFRDGSQLTVRSIHSPNDSPVQVSVVTAFGEPLTLPTDRILDLRFVGGLAIPLSELTPLADRSRGYFSPRPPQAVQVNQNVNGDRLQLGSVPYPWGLGLPGGAALDYELPEGTLALIGRFGLDDAAGNRGSVRLRVEANGELLHRTEEITATNRMIDLPRIPLTGQKQITLTVEFAGNGPIDDAAGLVDVYFLRKG